MESDVFFGISIKVQCFFPTYHFGLSCLLFNQVYGMDKYEISLVYGYLIYSSNLLKWGLFFSNLPVEPNRFRRIFFSREIMVWMCSVQNLPKDF